MLNGQAYNPMTLTTQAMALPTVTLSAVATTGPSGDVIGHSHDSQEKRGAFEWTPLDKNQTAPAQLSMWAADAGAQIAIATEPTHGGRVVQNELAQRLVKHRSHWFFKRNMRWTSQATAAAYTANEAHGGAAWTALCDIHDASAKAVALYCNSIFGGIARNAYGANQKQGRSEIRIKATAGTPCPAFHADTPEARHARALADQHFPALAQLPLEPFAYCFRDANRHRIDNVVAEMLGLDPADPVVTDMLAYWRILFAGEPNVNGRQRKIVAALAKHQGQQPPVQQGNRVLLARRQASKRTGGIMEITWKDYEALAATLYKVLGKDYGIEIMCYGRNCKVDDYQFDVIFRQPNGLQYTTTAIECKYLKDTVGRGTVNEFSDKIQHVPIDKGIIISRMGFTPPAMEAARRRNIELVEMRQPIDADWAGRITEAHATFRWHFTGFHSVKFNASKPTVEVGLLHDLLSWDVLPDDLKHAFSTTLIITKPRDEPKTLNQVCLAHIRDNPDDEDFIINFPDGTTLKVQGEEGFSLINSLKFQVHHSESVNEWSWNLKEKVNIIVKSIFDDREWLWYKDQRIIEQMGTDPHGSCAAGNRSCYRAIS